MKDKQMSKHQTIQIKQEIETIKDESWWQVDRIKDAIIKLGK